MTLFCMGMMHGKNNKSSTNYHSMDVVCRRSIKYKNRISTPNINHKIIQIAQIRPLHHYIQCYIHLIEYFSFLI